MGCSHSKLEDEEAVQICKDRKSFIKQAIEHRTKFASTHIAYILSLRQVSDALHDFIIQGDNNYKPHEFVDLLSPVKRIPPRSRRRSSSSEFITISPSSMPPKMIQDKPRTRVRANYLMANRTRQVRVEQRSPETFRVESFPPPPSRLKCDPDPEKVRLSSCPHPIYRVCIQWSKLLNSLEEKPVLDKLEFFASGMGSVYARQVREDPSWRGSGLKRYSGSETLDLVLADEDVLMTAEKLAEVAAKVLCHGMSVAVSSLAEFAINSADEHSKLVNQPEDAADDSTSGQHPYVNFNSYLLFDVLCFRV